MTWTGASCRRWHRPKPGLTPSLAQFEAWFRRPWIDLNGFLFDAPAEYMPSYGMHIAMADSYVGLLLSLNLPPEQKVTLTNYFVQYGIDLFGCFQAGHSWPAFGGHRSGRKLPIVLAGMLLHNQAMQNVSSLYPDSFGEDMQTVYINQIPSKREVSEGLARSNGDLRRPLRSSQRRHPGQPRALWSVRTASAERLAHPRSRRGNNWGRSYRRWSTSTCLGRSRL